MKKRCVYTINTKEGPIGFDNELELENYLLNNKNNLSSPLNIFHDIVFSENVKQKEIFSILKKNEEHANKIMDIKFNRFTGDMDPEGKTSNEYYKEYKGVTRLLEILKNPTTDKFLATPFNIENYRNNKIHKLVFEENMSPEEATIQVDETIDTWDVMAEIGTKMHSVAEFYFKDYTIDQIKEETNIPEHVLIEYLNQLKEFKNDLYKKYGNNAIFLSEYKVFNDSLKMVGIIDLLVIDESGQVHLYDFKTSNKESGEWYSVKEQTFDYQLGFYRHALAAYGIPVKHADLGIVPIQILNANYKSGTYDGVKIEDIQDRLKRKNIKYPNRLEWNLGKFYTTINSYIPIEIKENVVTKDYLNNLNDNLKKMFPNYKYKVIKGIDNIDKFIKYKVKDNNGKFSFYDTITEKTLTFNTREDLQKGVENYLERKENNVRDETEELSSKIREIISGKKDISTLVETGQTDKQFFPNIIKKYISPEWKVIDIPELMNIGVLAIQNTNSNYIDFLGFSSNYLVGDPINLGMGTDITGSFDNNKISKNQNMLNATHGNIELMKIMAAINLMPELLNGGNLKIGDIKVVNPYYSQSTSATSEQLTHTFNRLTSKSGINNNFKTDNLIFISFIDKFYDYLRSAINQYPDDNRFSNINTFYEENAAALNTNIKTLEDLRETLLKYFPSLQNAKPDKMVNSEELYLYVMITNQINYLSNIVISPITKDITKYNFIDGAYFSNPDTQRDSNLLTLSSLINKGQQRIRDNYLSWAEDFRKVVKDFKEGSNYGKSEEYILGFQNKIYKNLFEHDPDGNIVKDLRLKDPENMNNGLLKHEREFLKYVLYNINKLRHGIENNYDNRIDELKQSGEYFNFPLMRASGQSKIQDGNVVKETLAKTKKWFSNPIKMSKKAVDGVMNQEEQTELKNANDLYKMYNRFEISESNRDLVLMENDSAYFEKNIETVLSNFVMANIRKTEMNKILPVIQGIVTVMRLNAHNSGVDIEKLNNYIDDSLKTYIFNMSLINDEMKGIYQLASVVKSTASKLALAFNIKSGIREILQGLWKNINASFIKHYGEEQFGIEHYNQAMKIMIGDTATFVKDIDVIESLNLQYGMANMDINSMVEKASSNQKGISAFGSRHMFFMAGAPDYVNRMSIFIAQMIKDGSWKAHSMKDGKLIYDWKKDNRFLIYAKGLTTHSEYKNQRSLYLNLLEQLKIEGVTNEDGTPLKEGDSLIRAYSAIERDSLKSFANMMYGYYDHEDKALINNIFFGSLWLQFRTFFSATKNKYFLKGGEYVQGKWVHAKDENGNLLYYKVIHEEDGSITKEICDENDPEAIPLQDWEGRYMEGIFQSFFEGIKEWNNLGWDTAYNNFINDKTRMNNAKQFASDIVLWSIFGLLMAAIIKMWTTERNKERRKEDTSTLIYAQDGLVDMLNMAVVQSTDDLFIGSVMWNTAFDWQPPAFKMMNRMRTSAGDVIFGNKEMSKAIVDNIGFLNQGRRFWYNTIDYVKEE